MINAKRTHFSQFTSSCYKVIKILSLPETILWTILCAFNYKITPPNRIWHSVRMLHFASNSLTTDFLLKISFATKQLFCHQRVASRRKTLNPLTSPISQEDSIICKDIESCFLSLSTQGYTCLGLLSPETLKSFSDVFESSSFFADLQPQYSTLESPSSRKKTGRFFADPIMLSKNKVLTNFLRDPVLLQVLYRYFKFPPLLYQINAWKSFAVESSDLSQLADINSFNARYPHIDFASLKFLKLFIFLDPISKADGPFHFWPGSFRHKCRSTNDGRYDYDEISDIFGQPVIFTSSNPGIIFIADTSMYHCDGIVEESGYRRAIQYEFCLPFIRLGDNRRLAHLI
jgi:hypothetical protein